MLRLTVLICILLLACVCPRVENRASSSRYSYSRYSYGYRSSSSGYSRYSYRYSSSYYSYRSYSVRYTPTRYTSSYYSPSRSYSYSYYTRLYYSYYTYSYYSYYYRGTCTYTSSGTYSTDTCNVATTTTAAPTTAAPSEVSCSSGATLSENVGSFNSHNAYGVGSYTNSMSCSWIVAANPGYVVQLSFVSFDTEKNFDKVRVYDGTSSSASLLATFHGSTSSDSHYPGSRIVYSSGQYMYITFSTDSSITKNGFRAFYRQVLASSATSTTSAAAATTTAPSTTADPSGSSVTYCSGVVTLNENETSAIVSHSSSSGHLPSQTSGLGDYRNNMNCTWIVPGRSGKYLRFYIAYMNLESCYDKVTFDRGDGSPWVRCYATPPIGYTAVYYGMSRGTGVTVKFTTDGSVTRKGFIVTYSYVSSTSSSPTFSTANSTTSNYSAGSSTSNNVCINYAVNANGSAMGSFTCPNPFEPSDFTQCCGDDENQYCCKLEDNTPMIIGIIVGIICLLVVIVVIIFCCVRSCGETAAKKSGSTVKWRRSMNKVRAITAWRLASAGRSGAHVVPDVGTAATAPPNKGGAAAASSSGGAAATGFTRQRPPPQQQQREEPPAYSPPPVPPPSALYYGGYFNQHQLPPQAFHQQAPPPMYNDTAYPPQAFRM